jgi:hypothetical protein
MELFMNLKFSTVALAMLATVLAPPATADTHAPITRHSGMCDASGAVPVGLSLFAVANDEDNTLRVYKRDEAGESIYSQNIAEYLKIDETKNHEESDIEGATLIGTRIYWISSHGRNEEGKERPNRLRFFATDIETQGNNISFKPVGAPFLGLVQAFADSAELKDLDLGNAATKPTKSQEGLNIEGLTRTPEGHLLIGFRSPYHNKSALLIPLENPQEVIVENKQPKFGKPIPLYLEGLGIRSIEYSDAHKAYFIIAGSFDKVDNFRLYQWSGKPAEKPIKIDGVDFKGLHPEALVVYPSEKNRIQVLSDDGAEQVKGQDCKDMKKTPKNQSFRSIWVSLIP